MKIRTGFVSNSSSSSFVAYHFISLPEGESIESVFDDSPLPELEIKIREHGSWGREIGREWLTLDKETALKEIDALLRKDEETNSDSELMERRIAKAVKQLINGQKIRYDSMMCGEDDEEYLNRVKEMYPLANKTIEEVYEIFMNDLGSRDIYFVKEEYAVSDNQFCGRRNEVLDKDGEHFINGEGAEIKTLFKNFNVITVEWCYYSDQSDVDDFFDELDKPSRDQIIYGYGVEDEMLQGVIDHTFDVPNAEFFVELVKDMNDMLYDNGTRYQCSEEVAGKIIELMNAWSRVKAAPNDSERVIERLGVEDENYN